MNRTISMLCVLASMATSMALADDAAPAPEATPVTEATPVAEATPAAEAAPSLEAAEGLPAATSRSPAKAKKRVAPPAKTVTAAKAPAAKAPPAKKLPPPAKLPVGQIVEKNIAARGGAAAWRAVGSLTMSGELDAGGKKDPKLPFVMSLKRPQKSRLELKFQDQTAVQVWDGAQGWKVRPFLNRNEVEPFTAAEARSAAAAAELDGPLVDAAKKGTKVELAGTEVVEGRNTYKLKLTMKGGEQRHLWIDATTFLEAKIEGEPRRMDGRPHAVAVYYRDFKTVGGLKVPYTLETVVEKVPGSHKLTIQAVKLNPPLDDRQFAKPQLGQLAAK